MPISYAVDGALGLVRERWDGEITADEAGAHWRRLVADPEALALGRSLVHLRSLSLRSRGSDAIAVAREVVAPALAGVRWRAAALVSRPDQLGLSRQFQALADRMVELAIFTDEAEAVRWLQGGPGGPPSDGPG